MFRQSLVFAVTGVLILSFVHAAAPVGQGGRDLVLCSSLGFDRSPCSLEWWQYSPQWDYEDFKTLRLTNETWTDVAYGALFQDGASYLLASVGNNRGYSAVVHWRMGEYGQLTPKGCVLPNEPWRHYSGVAVCDLDHDGVSEILTIAVDKEGQRGVLCFRMSHLDGPAQETMVVKLGSRASGLACLPTGTATTEIVVAHPGNQDQGSWIDRYRVSAEGRMVSVDHPFLRIRPELGEAGGVAIQTMEDGKAVRLVVCTHDWGERDATHEASTAYRTDTEFLLAVGSAQRINSHLYQTDYAGNGKPVALVKVDSFEARRWTGVTFVGASGVPDVPLPAIGYKGGSGVIHLCGPFYRNYAVDAIARELNMPLTQHTVKQYQQVTSIPGYDFADLPDHDVIFITDVPLWALGGRGVRAVCSYVNAGGTLVFCDGPFAGKAGGYAGSAIEDMLPVTISTGGFGIHRDGPLLSDTAYCSMESSESLYYMTQRTCRAAAQSILSTGADIIVARWDVGEGHVIYCGALPLADGPPQSEFTVWHSLIWRELLSRCLK